MIHAHIDMTSAASDDSDWTFTEVTDADLVMIDDEDDDDDPTIREEIPSILRALPH